MSYPGSSPSPLPTFQETDGASPKELLSFLQDYTAKLKHDSIQELLHEKRGKALSLLDNLDRDFLLPFPLPSECSWNTLHEKIKLSEVIFDMLYRMARRCGEVLCLQENIARSIFTKLLNMAVSLDVWIDIQDLQPKEGYATPERLYTNCILAASGMLHAFKEGVAIDHGGPPGWKILRAVTEECSRVCQGKWLLHCSGLNIETHRYSLCPPEWGFLHPSVYPSKNTSRTAAAAACFESSARV
ncbi:hypothetical protein PHLGIDRAFT_190722 [Phlebiopsis gigantea 11061_1 CR5-6]|uniref:Uncharacterized protein n=1 Tax=Phlebiopsis gigantea (strain 11061_1 CR5-6) TaxID=745531 RepID=A0A0C3S787_PHLG1|nr:hypothetical protein PHLGIDRAFT_190722 [Phlebiopsis gigantea 11061_1 CR5-6]